MEVALLMCALTVLAVLLALLGITIINLLILPRLVDFRDVNVGARHVVPLQRATDALSARYSEEEETPSLQRVSRQESWPLVAALVPARNEEANIEACIRALLTQDYPNLEIWVYDDASTDATPAILNTLASEAGERLRVVAGRSEPPPGWLGKAHACHRLYEAMCACSAPDFVLFTDADVRFEPQAVSKALAAARALDAGLLSVFPRQATVTWAERLAVPVLLHWTVYTFLPLPLAFSRRGGPAFAAANGQFMLFRRDAYEASGGHAAVRAEVLEDVVLSRAVKRAGYRALLADGGPLVRTRMYGSAAEVWQGYSKNVYAFFGYSPFFVFVGVVALMALYVVPVPLALYSAILNPGAPWATAIPYVALAQYGVAVLGRFLLAARFAYRPLDALLHPVAIVYVIAIIVNSTLWAITGRSSWKGRPARVKVP